MDDAIRRTVEDATTLLSARGTGFAVIGGIAVSFRGEPRMTADLDLVAALDVDGALDLLQALPSSKLEPLFDDVEDVVRSSFIVPLRHRETGIGVDLAVGLSGFERRLIERATEEAVGDTTVPVATAEDLLLMKMLAGRARDVEDARGIVSRAGSSLDWDYVFETARQLQEAVDQDLLSPLRRFRAGS